MQVSVRIGVLILVVLSLFSAYYTLNLINDIHREKTITNEKELFSEIGKLPFNNFPEKEVTQNNIKSKAHISGKMIAGEFPE